tara:strand:- start:58 stop:438 length:381 start_codon:yes stop_codon:yes gene_type:complete
MSKPFKMKAAGHNNSPMQKNFPKDIGAKPGDSPLETFSGEAALGGAAKGASMGMAFGPWGAAIGGVAGGIMGGIKGGKAMDAEAAAMAEQEKNAIVAAKLKKDAEREALGYGETDSETGLFSPTTT